MRNIELYSWWGYFSHACYIAGLDCYGLHIKGLCYIHVHTGIVKEISKDWPWFRIRSFELFGNKWNKWKGFTVPFIKYYSI